MIGEYHSSVDLLFHAKRVHLRWCISSWRLVSTAIDCRQTDRITPPAQGHHRHWHLPWNIHRPGVLRRVGRQHVHDLPLSPLLPLLLACKATQRRQQGRRELSTDHRTPPRAHSLPPRPFSPPTHPAHTKHRPPSHSYRPEFQRRMSLLPSGPPTVAVTPVS